MSRGTSTLQSLGSRLHFFSTAALALLAVPLIIHSRLPVRLHWGTMLVFFWVSLGSKSVPRALLFVLLAFPPRQTIGPFLARWRRQKIRIALALVFLAALSLMLQFAAALLLTIDALLVLELAERARADGQSFAAKAAGVLAVAAYLFLGISLVLVYNDIIMAARLPVSYDSALNHLDMRLLGGHSVSELAHRLYGTLPAWMLRFLDVAYFQMFLVVGGAFLIAAYQSPSRGLRFAGTCLTAYYVALLVFFVWPTYGPYLFCPGHLDRYPQYMTTYLFHQAGIAGLAAAQAHRMQALASGYYIAFPSLHIALPGIAMWYLRRWGVVFWLLLTYNVVIAAAIVVLEWHYALDLPGGIAVAVLAIVIVGRDEAV